MDIRGARVVVIGGGTGSFTVLRALKNYVSGITALVSMVDNGGSTGQLRDEYGVLPPGDIRQCLVALSNSSDEMRKLFNYRFGEGSLEGHTFGNMFLVAVEKMSSNFGDAVALASEVLNISGRVVPITLQDTTLVLQDGHTETIGEHQIEGVVFSGNTRPRLELRPRANINPDARRAILDADMIVIAPGSLYESLIASLIVDGVAEALGATKAKIVQVTNLVTKPGQTDGWSVADYVAEIERFVGTGVVDVVLYNAKKPTDAMIAQYAHDGEFPVVVDESMLARAPYEAVGADLLAVHTEDLDPNDKLAVERTLIRHDPHKLARALMRIYFS